MNAAFAAVVRSSTHLTRSIVSGESWCSIRWDRTRCQEPSQSKFFGLGAYVALDRAFFSQCFQNPSRWALHVVNELPLCTCDRVALIGDAVRFALLTRKYFDEI